MRFFCKSIKRRRQNDAIGSWEPLQITTIPFWIGLGKSGVFVPKDFMRKLVLEQFWFISLFFNCYYFYFFCLVSVMDRWWVLKGNWIDEKLIQFMNLWVNVVAVVMLMSLCCFLGGIGKCGLFLRIWKQAMQPV